jgi:hypothetical protein
MRRPGSVPVLLVACGCLALTLGPAAAVVRVSGSTTVNPLVEEAADVLRREPRVTNQVDTLGGTSRGIAALAERMAALPIRYRRAAAETAPIMFTAVVFRNARCCQTIRELEAEPLPVR